VIGAQPSSHHDHLALHALRTRKADLRKVALSWPIFSFEICGIARDLLLPVLQDVNGFADGSVTPDLTYGGSALSIRPLGVSKWSGVLAFCAARGLDPNRILAVGDGENDVELLSCAAITCAPTDKCAAALALATHHIGPAREGGGASALGYVN
jgi:hydroxymethylpyrimidine pyrophosphatase-like HAD family hydrolase